jgi:hypothetical protein
MKWAIVCTQPMMLQRWVWNEETQRQESINSEVPSNTIINIIEYDGIALYMPPENTELKQVADEKNIGDLAN